MFVPVLLALAIGVSLSQPAAAEPYKVEGFELGMSLVEARRAPALGPGNRLICNVDQEVVGIRPTNVLPPIESTSVAAPACGVFRYGNPIERPGLPQEWLPARLKLGSLDMYPTLNFVTGENPRPELRLASIQIRSNAQFWNEILQVLTSRYGQPVSRGRPKAGTAASFADNEIVTWDNGDSSISAIKRADRYQRATITFEHKGLAALARWRAAGGGPLP